MKRNHREKRIIERSVKKNHREERIIDRKDL